MMILSLYFMAFCVGVAIAVQAAVNGGLAAALGANSVFAAFVSFACGTAVLAVATLARGNLGEALAALPTQPWWRFAGGFLGAAFVFGTVYLAPRVGLLNLLVLVIAGQLLSSMIIDNFGLMQMAVRKVSPLRVVGALVMVAGVALTLFGDRITAAMAR